MLNIDSGNLEKVESLQALWNDYGEISRARINTGPNSGKTLIIKSVRLPSQAALKQHQHPQGWQTNHGHARKVNSYQVEAYWYRYYAKRCHPTAKIADCYGVKTSKQNQDTENINMDILLEDLSAIGFSEAVEQVSSQHVNACLKWLAFFHASFMGEQPQGLWATGCYWHLATRQDEWAVLAEGPLKHQAKAIDQCLASCRYQTLVHGDAKLANFCFTVAGDKVAAVDFQYVGGGCGIKDVVYFFSSCLDAAVCERDEQQLLSQYFNYLSEALHQLKPTIDARLVEQEWRAMYSFAWADFYRFLKGWNPNHWKLNPYSQRLTQQALDLLAV